MKIRNEYRITIGEDGLIVLREPTTKEWNEFTAAQFNIGRKGKISNQIEIARQELFDKLLIAVENLEDDEGKITVETKHRIPARLKSRIIIDTFESGEEVDVKNS